MLGKLHEFRGESRFTTWAYKFALYEAAAKTRRRGWQAREVPLEPDGWALIAGDAAPERDARRAEVLTILGEAIRTELSPQQRNVLLSVVVDGVPIDVLAERRNTTRGALYRTIHDARRKLRAAFAAQGIDVRDVDRIGRS